MSGRFPFQKLAKYPHMKPEDILVWERFLHLMPSFFDTVDYDVAVGKGAPQNPEHPEAIQADGKILTQKKIDVVGYAGDRTYVVEVGPIADMRKLGQILTYTRLFKATYPEVPNPIPMVLCGAIERELEDDFAEHGILVEFA